MSKKILIANNYDRDTSTFTMAQGLVKEYSPCNKKFMNANTIHQYIKGKLDRTIKKIKYDHQDIDELVDGQFVKDIWTALCPLEKGKPNVPSKLLDELEKMVKLKTKKTKESSKKKLFCPDSNSKSESESESGSESESKSENEDRKVILKKSTKTNTKTNTKTKTNIDKTKKHKKMVKTDSESDSESE